MSRGNISVGYTRRKLGLGGDATYGSEIKSRDVSFGSVGGYQNTALSTAGGAAAGAIAGSVVPGVGTAIGAVAGAVIGFVGGLFGSRSRKKRKAAAKEAQRQATLQAMENKMETDYYNIKNSTFNDFSEGEGYYAKMGGIVPKRAYAVGGRILNNSSNTKVVYGNTHEQYNSNTGETGVGYGNVEVEGGGTRNGYQYAGEIIKEDGNQSRVYSDTLKIPYTNTTFAKAMKQISDKKGYLEKQNEIATSIVDSNLENISKTGYNKQRLGTISRNIEKSTYDININSGMINELDDVEDKLYSTQEIKASSLGLRGNPYSAKFGGSYGRQRMDFGGYMTAGKFALNGINALMTHNAISFEESLPVPEIARIEAPQYNTNYSITSQLAELDADKRSADNFITSNTSNAQVARNALAMTAIRAQRYKGNLYHTKNVTEQQLFDRNVEARHQTNLTNNQIIYQNALNKYNKAVDINSKKIANQQQFLQSTMDLADNVAADKMEKYKIGSQNILQASDADRERLESLYKDIWGVDFGSIKNLFKRK